MNYYLYKTKIFLRFFNPKHIYLNSKIFLLTYIDSRLINKYEKSLFVDLGANLGQSFHWFSSFYDNNFLTFELFEPNPFCFQELMKNKNMLKKCNIYNLGVGSRNEKVKFYGLSNNEGGKFAQGGSIVKNHNSISYHTRENSAIYVNLINFSNYIFQKSNIFNKIVVKMDIEGAEIDVLESLIKSSAIKKIDILYVEFHSKYLVKKYKNNIYKKEIELIKKLRKFKNLKLRIWH
jgi:FkbM family methyltransferase